MQSIFSYGNIKVCSSYISTNLSLKLRKIYHLKNIIYTIRLCNALCQEKIVWILWLTNNYWHWWCSFFNIIALKSNKIYLLLLSLKKLLTALHCIQYTLYTLYTAMIHFFLSLSEFLVVVWMFKTQINNWIQCLIAMMFFVS